MDTAQDAFSTLRTHIERVLASMGNPQIALFEHDQTARRLWDLLAPELDHAMTSGDGPSITLEPSIISLNTPCPNDATADGPHQQLVLCVAPSQHALTPLEEQTLDSACGALGINAPRHAAWALAALALAHAGIRGKAVILMPRTNLSRTAWRMGQRTLVDARFLETVATLPAPIRIPDAQGSTGMSAGDPERLDALVVLSKDNEAVTFVDIESSNGADDARKAQPFQRSASYGEIIASGYLLNPSWYRSHPSRIEGIRLGSVAKIVRGVSKSYIRDLEPVPMSCAGTKGTRRLVPYLTSRDFEHGIDYCELSAAYEAPRALCFDSDAINVPDAKRITGPSILLSRTGLPFKVCRFEATCLECDSDSYIIADNLYRIEPSPKLDPDYLLAYLASSQGQQALERVGSGAASMRQISPNDLRDMLIPLPGLEEQRAIAQTYLAIQVRQIELMLQERALIEERNALFC